MTKEQIIQSLIDDNGYETYLEIGSQNDFSFSRIKAKIKKSVDPDPKAIATYKMTSDDYFNQNSDVWQIIFIDGLHEFEQVERDIVNASKCLTQDGCIVLHDLNPQTEEQQAVPRISKQWTGDCWKAFVGFREKYPDVESYAYSTDWGVGIIKPLGQVFEEGFISDISFGEFNKNKAQLLNFID